MAVKLRRKPGRPGWWLIVHHDGKRTSRALGEIDKSQAVRIQKQLQARLVEESLGLHTPPSPTVAEYAQEWLAGVELKAERSGKHATSARYEIIVRKHIVPHWDARRLASLTDRDGRQLLRTWAQSGMARATADMHYNVLRQLLSAAKDDGYLSHIPLPPLTSVFESKPKAKPVRVVPSAELAELLTVAESKAPEPYAALFLVLARTGMRLGEALALQWDNVNLFAGSLDVVASYGKFGLSTTKTGQHRTIPLSPLTTAVLKRVQTHQRTTAMAAGRDTPAWVFTAADLVHITEYRARAWWQRCLKAVGCYGYRLHDLRHTFATTMLQAEPIHVVQALLGHATATQTLNTYGHVMPGHVPDMAALDGSKPHPTPRATSREAGVR